MAELSRRRRLQRGFATAVLLLVVACGGAVLIGLPVAWPFDVVVNLGAAPELPELRVPEDGKHRLVVLQHGLWRTPASLGKLARALRAHGYDVINPGYPSTRGSIEQFAGMLHDAVERQLASQPADEVVFVGHSMGGLVIEEYLRRADARPPAACVYLGTPHRGAVLCDLRKHWFVFRLAMGHEAALQLSPGAAIHQRPIPFGARSGTIVGNLGAGNASIPGDDDGTVAVGEATFAGAKATVQLPLGHTRLTCDARAIRQVLSFLRRGEFAPVTEAR